MDVSTLEKFDSSLRLHQAGQDFELQNISSDKDFKSQTLLFLNSNKFLSKLPSHKLDKTCLITTKSLASDIESSHFDWIYTSPQPSISMCLFSQYFYTKIYGSQNNLVDGRQMGSAKIHPTAEIAQGVFIGEDVEIGEGVTINSGTVIHAKAIIGDKTFIHSNVTIYPNVHLGSECIIHSGVVIGADGFGFEFKDGVHHKIWHLGGVRISHQVEVGANSCIDAGTFSPTMIGAQCKIDNHVQVAHNVNLGKGVILCGHVAIGGSCKIGDYCVFAGKSAMGDNLSLGAQCQVAGGAMINSSWDKGFKLGGHPARPLNEWLRGLAYLRNHSLKR